MNKTELLYAKSNRELLSLVWAFKNPPIIGKEIQTDQQSVSFTISDKNPNVELYPKTNMQARNNKFCCRCIITNTNK